MEAKKNPSSMTAWKETPECKQAAADADKMTKAQKIAEIMRVMMTLAGEPEEAIAAQVAKCLQEGGET